MIPQAMDLKNMVHYALHDCVRLPQYKSRLISRACQRFRYRSWMHLQPRRFDCATYAHNITNHLQIGGKQDVSSIFYAFSVCLQYHEVVKIERLICPVVRQ